MRFSDNHLIDLKDKMQQQKRKQRDLHFLPIKNLFQLILVFLVPISMSNSSVLKYTRPDLATLTYHPVRPLDVISREVDLFSSDGLVQFQIRNTF
jgi:hypothetical protein